MKAYSTWRKLPTTALHAFHVRRNGGGLERHGGRSDGFATRNDASRLGRGAEEGGETRRTSRNGYKKKPFVGIMIMGMVERI